MDADALPANSIQPATRAEWRAWLAENHGRAVGVWLVIYKKASRKAGVEYAEAVEEALCFGWIDGKSVSVDVERWRIWFSPRQPSSIWAKSNRERVARLLAAGLTAPAGLAKVKAAQADGSWDVLGSVEALEVPADLEQALDGDPAARRHFDAFPDSVKRGFLWWVASAKRPQTRARRIKETARLAAENRRTLQ